MRFGSILLPICTVLLNLHLPVQSTGQAQDPGLGPEIASKRKNISIGYLTAIRGELKDRQGLAISGAISLALDEINNDPTVLPDVNLVLRWNDTRGETSVATSAMIDMICGGVSAFFGPEGSCLAEARIAQAKNIPMISYKCADYETSEIPVFTRTDIVFTQVAEPVISLLKYYGWNKFSIIYEDSWHALVHALEEQVGHRQLTINDVVKVADRLRCCQEKLDCCSGSNWNQIVQLTQSNMRIYVFLGSPYSLTKFMDAMAAAQLFQNGKYMIIYVDTNTHSSRQAHKYLWRPDVFDKYSSCEQLSNDFLKRSRSLFVVTLPELPESYASFAEKVREYNSKEPFRFAGPSMFKVHYKFTSIYAAYLYDAVKLYAAALHKLLSTQEVLTDEVKNQTNEH